MVKGFNRTFSQYYEAFGIKKLFAGYTCTGLAIHIARQADSCMKVITNPMVWILAK